MSKKKPAKKKTTKKPAKYGQKDIKLFKDLLIKAKVTMLNGMNYLTNENLKKSQREASGDLSGYTYHMADMASDVYERDFQLQLASGERELLFKMDEALRRLKDGKYGSCLECGKKISKTRLKAIPQTAYCKNCQEKEEKKKII